MTPLEVIRTRLPRELRPPIILPKPSDLTAAVYAGQRHLASEHLVAYHVWYQLSQYKRKYNQWPKRSRLFQALRNAGFDSLHQVDLGVWLLDYLFENGCEERDRACGTPVFKMSLHNYSGPMTVRYGLDPFPDIGWAARGNTHTIHSDDWLGHKLARSSLVFGNNDFWPATRRPADSLLKLWVPEQNLGSWRDCEADECQYHALITDEESTDG